MRPAAAPVGATEVATDDDARISVWNALSDLYLDTDVTLSRAYIVRTLAASPYSLDELHQERSLLESDVNQLVMHLQFQDRVDQIVSHIVDDMQRLEQAGGQLLDHDACLPPVQSWLSRLSATYTTLEQQALHEGQHAAGPANNASSVTFF